MEPSFDFTKYTFDELLDAARHIDAAAHPQRAAALSDEIDRRIRAGDQPAYAVRAGATWGDAVWHWTAAFPWGRIAFTNRWIVLSAPRLFKSGDFRLQRDEVTAIREWRRVFVRGFQIVHTNKDLPAILFFRSWSVTSTRRALLDRGWPVEPATGDVAEVV